MMTTFPVARSRTLRKRIRCVLLLLRGLVLGLAAWLVFMHFAISFNLFWIKLPGDEQELPLLNRYPLVPLAVIVIATTCWSVAATKIDHDTVESNLE